jgi:hypothetical protein
LIFRALRTIASRDSGFVGFVDAGVRFAAFAPGAALDFAVGFPPGFPPDPAAFAAGSGALGADADVAFTGRFAAFARFGAPCSPTAE